MTQIGTEMDSSTAAPPLPLKEQFFRFVERFGHVMSRILLTVLYLVLVAPAGIFMSLFGDPLKIIINS